ncbi:unnamed protein product [Echinostoma caproni]|uniref:Transposase n=1 Tax=Echinostoma caproni TaxID=27848 RepID=A0A183AH95_9TREM|nr:unnamed protein product [Echinostoma caproni]
MLRATSKDADKKELSQHYGLTLVKQKSLLSSKHLSALKDSKDKSDLDILHSDKGFGTVLMDLSDYQRKVECIFNDPSKLL